jgi:hypothetical protein
MIKFEHSKEYLILLCYTMLNLAEVSHIGVSLYDHQCFHFIMSLHTIYKSIAIVYFVA